jgi:thiamine pyrophosphokinase
MAAVAIVCTGGGSVAPHVRAKLPAGALVIAADSGLHIANELGLPVDAVVGDLDSVAAEALEAAVAGGARVDRFPTDKDATDFELALDAAVQAGVEQIVVVGGSGGRLDHLLANLMLLASPLVAEAYLGDATVAVARAGTPVAIEGALNSLVSLIPVGGDARGVTTEGLRWRLRDDTLPFGASRGVSNELIEPSATVSLADGVLLVIQPDSGTGVSS